MKHARKMLLGANSTFFFLSTNQLLDLANAYFIFCLVAIKKKNQNMTSNPDYIWQLFQVSFQAELAPVGQCLASSHARKVL